MSGTAVTTYPYCLLEDIPLSPILPRLKGSPLELDLSVRGEFLEGLEPGDQRAFQKKLDNAMEGKFHWGLSSYLEDRRSLLADCPQMVREERFYHLGLDVIIPAGTPLHAPLDGVVRERGFEEGKGNFGGYVLLEHSSPRFETFYTLFGHLKEESLPPEGRRLGGGDVFGLTGEYEENGNWFYHTHLQVLTGKGREEGWLFKGYCPEKDLAAIDGLCPSPVPLFIRAQT